MTSMDAAFNKAVAHIGSSKIAASNDVKLELYAYYKVATTAVTPQSANISRPGMFDFQGRAKYDAWVKHGSELEKAHHGKSTPELATLAKARYIEIAKDKFQFDEGQAQVLENAVQAAPQREKTADELLDEDEEESPPHPSASTGGMSVSTMSMGHGHQPNPDGAHELHDLAASGDAQAIKAMKPSLSQLNMLDDYGLAPIHLAADKGHVAVVRLLLELGADPSLPDSEGMTALDTAQAVENGEIINLLRQHLA